MRRLAIACALFLCASVAHAQEQAPRVIRGSGEGYSASIMIADVSAALVIPTTILPTWSNSSPWIWSIPLSGAPSVLTGMFIHIAHERYVAAVTSFFGWSSVIASSWAVGGILSMLLHLQSKPGQDLSMLGVGAGVSVGMLGTAGMTILDAWMARPFKRTHVTPNVSFEAHGATAGLLGSF